MVDPFSSQSLSMQLCATCFTHSSFTQHQYTDLGQLTALISQMGEQISILLLWEILLTHKPVEYSTNLSASPPSPDWAFHITSRTHVVSGSVFLCSERLLTYRPVEYLKTYCLLHHHLIEHAISRVGRVRWADQYSSALRDSWHTDSINRSSTNRMNRWWCHVPGLPSSKTWIGLWCDEANKGKREGVWEKRKGCGRKRRVMMKLIREPRFVLYFFLFSIPSLKLFPISLFKKIQCT